MKKKKRLSVWLLVLLIAVAGGILIWIDNPIVHFVTSEKKLTASLTVAGICMLLLLCDDLIARLWQGIIAMSFIQRLRALSGKTYRPEEAIQAEKEKYSETLGDIRGMLRHLYGYFWRRKTRILIITGAIADVELLTPKLTQALWQEDQGTLLLWGGTLSTPADLTWLMSLRKLSRRPADGIVWVTSALDESASAEVLSPDAMDALVRSLSQHYDTLGLRLPLYVWSLHQQIGELNAQMIQPVGCLLPSGCTPLTLERQIAEMVPGLIAQGVQQISAHFRHHFLLSLADRLTRAPERVTGPLSTFLNPYRPLPLAGVLFSTPSQHAVRSVSHHWGLDNRWSAIPDSVMELPSELRPHKPGVSGRQILTVAGAVVLVLGGASMMVSFVSNRNQVSSAQELVERVSASKQAPSVRLHSLVELQKTLSRLQYREQHGVPWYARAGLSLNAELLTALWPRYSEYALPLLRDAAAEHLRQELQDFVQLPPDCPLREKRTKAAYDRLKLYLMLSRPEKMDADWFAAALMHDWPQRAEMRTGIWQGIGPSLLSFYGQNLPRHPVWRLHTDEALADQVRALLVHQMGIRNSESTLYQKMLSQVANQYADMRLMDMVGDTDAARLFSTSEVVPGMFTRQAWDEAVQPAIDHAVSERREEIDWVLGDNKQLAQQAVSPETLKQRLTTRYFADYSSAWLDFLNSLRWQKTATLSDAIDQLTLVADVRQSPLVALMNTLNVQGRAGQTGDAVSDSLVKSAKNLFGHEQSSAIDQNGGMHGPLDSTFGPVLALLDNHSREAPTSPLSLQTFLTRVTQVRLRLQQVTNATDPQAMSQALAQTVFQGKAVDLTETRDYGSLLAAGLGQEWSGFGQTVFVRPMEQAWQQVLQPAADSLNEQWRSAVVDDWNSAFGGRYPFKNTSSDVSLPLLAKYLNGDSGRIARFLQTRLNGVLHKEGSHWVADSINAQGLTFNPAFLDAMNTLSHISDVIFTDGDAGLHFELRPGTADGVMQTALVIDDQKLVYMNQMPAWKRFSWPADTEAPGASLSWVSTQAGTRQYADVSGTWGWIRLLDKATVNAYPGLSSSYSLSWHAQDGRMLSYTLRTEAGEGPLALLKLRNFILPETIFSVSATGSYAESSVEDEGAN